MINKTELLNKHRACRTHCCIIHGCKYGHKDCPVCLGVVEQEYLCESCGNMVFEGRVKTTSEMKDKINKEFLKENRKIKLYELKK